ncbi:MAG: hypothetical protein CMI18_13975 [Opitutaceae bacterium]|nr:hypothetical protein [Opitutaceae bacterium]
MASEPSAWKRYYDEWAPALLLFARQRTRFQPDAEDVVQEAFLKVWEKYDQKSPIPNPY